MRNNLCRAIASTLVAIENCRRSDNMEWLDRHEARLKLLGKMLPSGAGFDSGSSVVLAESSQHKLVMATSFHHMNEHGYYDGWTEHRVIVLPNLMGGWDIRVTGKDRNAIKGYIADTFLAALDADVDFAALDERVAEAEGTTA